MKNITRKLVSLCVAAATLSAAMLLPGATVAAAGSSYAASRMYRFNDKNCGFYTEPTAAGTYQTVILMHGNGKDCASWMAQQMPIAMESWTQQGYLQPMNIIMPWISYKDANDSCGVYGHRDFAVNYTDDLGQNLTSITSKADPSKYKTAIAGYSMGGCDALTAAALYPDLYQELGSLSSSFTFHKWDDPNNDWSTFHSTSDMHFSSNLRSFVTYGEREWQKNANDALFKYSGDHYYKDILTGTFGLTNTEFHVCQDPNWGYHGNKLFFREIFMYLYYLQNGVLPSESVTEQACGNCYLDYGQWKTLSKPNAHDPSLSSAPLTVSAATSTKTKVTHGESYTVSVNVQGGTGNYTYDWQYSVYADKNYVSTTRTDANGKSLNGNSSLYIADATRDIYYRCKVSDGNTTFYSDPVFISVAAKINSISSTGYGVTLKPNATYTITVEAEGLELSYMWEYSCDGGVTWYKSTNTGYNTKTATYINREENHVQVIYYRCTVTSAGTSTTATIKLGK